MLKGGECTDRDCTPSQDILPQVNWLILGSKLPGRVLPECYAINSRLWLSGALDLGEIFWLAVDYHDS